MKRALITGVTGQDGSYLAEWLLAKDYTVHGIIRRASSFNTGRIEHLIGEPSAASGRFVLHYGDLTDGTGLRQILERARPDEVYHLGAQSHVRVSFDQPEYTADVNATGTLRLLEALRDHVQASGNAVRLYHAASSEMFGSSPPPQDERTPFHPRSPYAVSKVAAYWNVINYREAYGLFLCNGISFNHESPRRGETFVTRKITRAAGRIKLGLQSELTLGNLEARRDWSFAGDHVEAMWSILQQSAPGDFVVASGESYSVRELLDAVFGRLGLDWHAFVRSDPRYFRPAEVEHLCGDASKLRAEVGWRPSVSFDELVSMMLAHDLELARQEQTLREAGHDVRVSERGG